MALRKYFSPEEQQKIKKTFATGKYTYEQLGEIFFASKGTMMNIVKGYKYNGYKEGYMSRLNLESKDKLDELIKTETEKAQEASKRGNMLAYSLHKERLKVLYQYQVRDNIYEPLKQHRLQCEQSAWEGLADFDYAKFAYNADMWQILTDCIGDMCKNPFKLAMKGINARGKSHAVRFSNLTRYTSLKSRNLVLSSVSKDSWILIQKILPEHELPRGKKPIEDKKYMQAILNCLSRLSSFRATAKRFEIDEEGLRRTFHKWYKQGIFADLLQLVSVCPELQAIEPQLIEMERIRQEKGIVPRIKDLQIKNNPSSE